MDASELCPLLARDGVVLFRHATRARLLDVLGTLAELRVHPHGTERGETVIEPGPSARTPGGEGFSRHALAPHTDRALTPRPPALVAVLVERAAPSGGHSLLADAGALSLPVPERVCPLILDAGTAGAFPVLESSGEGVPGFVRLRFREDEIARPRATGTEGKALLAAVRALGAHAEEFALRHGEGYLAHNLRVLHGRTAFRGYRRATRYLADLRPAHPYGWMNEGFQPTN